MFIDNSTMDINKEIGLRLKAAREAQKLVLREVVELLPELTISTLGGYESGRRAISIEVAKKLAAVLNVDAAYLLTLTNESEPMHKLSVKKDIIFDQLIEIYTNMTNSQRYDLVLHADEVLNKPVIKELKSNIKLIN